MSIDQRPADGGNPFIITQKSQSRRFKELQFLEEQKAKRQRTGKDESLNQVDLSIYQRSAYDRAANGENLFITGGAGTGKSQLLKKIQEGNPLPGVFVTASTGIAACNVGGITLHRFAGIGTAGTYEHRLKNARRFARENWLDVHILIIDEISMVSASLWDDLEKIARDIRQDKRPFGGIQLLLFGDFYQLPPVSTKVNKERYCFFASSWERCIPRQSVIELTEIFRQQGDDRFINILNEIRVGKLSDESNRILQGCNRDLQLSDPSVIPLKLYCTNFNTDIENAKCLDALGDVERRSYEAKDWFKSDSHKSLLDQMTIPPKIELAVGAQVMLLRNLDEKLVNGSIGKVVELSETGAKVKFLSTNKKRLISKQEISVRVNGVAVATRYQIPLRLAYAITIHKSQGLTFDSAEIDLSGAFEYGQAYVALSRVRSLEGLKLRGFNPARIKCSDDVKMFYSLYFCFSVNPLAVSNTLNKKIIQSPNAAKIAMLS